MNTLLSLCLALLLATSCSGIATNHRHLPETLLPSQYGYFDYIRTLNSTQTRVTPNSGVQEVTVQHNGQQQKSYNLIHLPIFLPYGKKVIDPPGAAILAAHHFNTANETIVPQVKDCGYRITLEFHNTMRSPLEASRQLYDVLMRQPEGVGTPHQPYPGAIIGALFSSVSIPLATLSGVFKLPMINHGSTSTKLDDKGQCPTFGRVIASTRGTAGAMAKYFTEIKVLHLGVLHVGDEYGESQARELQSAAEQLGIKVVVASFVLEPTNTLSSRIEQAIRQLRQSDFRYFVGVFYKAQLKDIMREAYRHGIAGPGYFWMFQEELGELTRGYVVEGGGDDTLVQALHGSAVITTDSSPDVLAGRRGYDAFMEAWPEGLISNEEFESYLQTKLPFQNHPLSSKFRENPNYLTRLMYDAVMSVGLAACKAAKERNVFFSGTTLYEAFKQNQFDGASGRVVIDQKTGTRDHNTVLYSMYNIVANNPEENGNVKVLAKVTSIYENNAEMNPTTELRPNEISAQWIPLQGVDFIYSNDETTAPMDLPPLHVTHSTMADALQIFGYVLCGFILLLSLLAASWTYLHRNTKVIKKAQPEFLIMLCAGTFVMGTTIVPMSLEEPVDQNVLDGACMSLPWLFSIGFVVSFSALLSKQIRINKIFQTKQFRRVEVRPKDVLGPFVILFFLNFTVLLTWTLVAPIEYVRSPSGSHDRYGRLQSTSASCSVENTAAGITFLSVLLAINFVVILYANVEAYKARGIKTEFSESRYIGISMVCILQAYLIGLPVMATATDSRSSLFATMTILITVTCLAILLPIFMPKYMFLRQWKQEVKAKEEQKKAQDEGKISKTQMVLRSSTPEGIKILDKSEEETIQTANLRKKIAQAQRQTVMLKKINFEIKDDLTKMRQPVAK